MHSRRENTLQRLCLLTGYAASQFKYPQQIMNLLLFLLAVTPSPYDGVARGCECSPAPPLQARIAEYDIVFSATVKAEIFGQDVPDEEGFSEFILVYSLEVKDVWKGTQLDKRVELVTGVGSCDLAFREERTYLFYARTRSDGKLTTDMCDPTKTLSRAEEDLRLLGKLRSE